MSQALDLLDQAMDAAREELRLLKGGDVDGAQRAAGERERLVRESWDRRDGCIELEMRRALERLRELHEGVVGEARRQREQIREELREVRGRKKRSVAYGAQRRSPQAYAPRFLDRKS